MVGFQSEGTMILTIILAIATVWLGIVAIVCFREDPKDPSNIVRFLASFCLLAAWVFITV